MSEVPEEFKKKMMEERIRINEELKIRLADAPKLRDIGVCKKCRHFWKHEDGLCGCRNTIKSYGHPWCRETGHPVAEDLFEKVRICIRDEDHCPDFIK